MGLDMYFEKFTYLTKEQRKEITIKDTNKSRVKYIFEEIGYLRKANAIHNWIVKNVQNDNDNCERYFLSKENLGELLTTINLCLGDNTLASQLLPTQSGFFFGSTDYDEYYFRDLEETKKIIENAIKESDTGSIYYHASW